MSRPPDDHVRRALWIQLFEIADQLNQIAVEWIGADEDLNRLEGLIALTEGDEQYEPPLSPPALGGDDDIPF